MNIYQKLAFLVVAVLGLAWLAKDDLVMVIALAAVVALLTLSTTWKLIFSTLEMSGLLLGGIGHGVGWVGDGVVDWSETRRRSLSVPAWDNLKLQTPTTSTSTVEPSEQLDVPDFLKDDAKRADDAGIRIFDPAN